MPAALPIREELSASELRALARRESKGRVAARLAGMDRLALRDAVVRYNAEGVAGLYDRPLPGFWTITAPSSRSAVTPWNALTATPERQRFLTSYPWLPSVSA
ncbi:helix-turn-helix domain-containing protein [Azospirillum largimobile]